MTNGVKPLRIGVWQTVSIPGDVDANLAALDEAAGEASRDGIELLVTPEMFVTGYNIGDEVARLAADQPLERVGEIAARHGIAILAGGPERHETEDPGRPANGGPERLEVDDPEHLETDAPAIANAAWLFDDGGAVLARHRKIQLFGDLDRTRFTAGDAVVTMAGYRGLNIAILICFDVEYPEAVRAAALAGADLVAVPTAQMHPYSFVNEHLIRVRAWENSLYVAYANQFGPDGSLDYVGLSVVADPLGRHVARAGPSSGEFITADVDPAVIAEARSQNPYLAEVRSGLFRREPRTRQDP